jgi:hypothetical protein
MEKVKRKRSGVTPLESPAIYGEDDINKASIPYPVRKSIFSNGVYRKAGIKAPTR